ncbi:tyrosine--tRNA ligase [Candidatus Microgenomates bacterium]|nr:tyrosine--tRNA ligase [Candidatus Microgenomates bacterium]
MAMDQIDELLTRGVANIIPNKTLLAKLLSSGKKLNVFLGIDPTATRIHLGHAVSLRKLQAFAEFGHNATFLIGDFTALIGDTSDKDAERPVLTSEQIEQNFQDYKKQVEKILDFSKVKIVYNSEWLTKLTFTDIVKLTQHFSAGDFVGRELIKKRLEENKRVGLHELLYPAMQGYDSYFMDTDIQIGGTDQTFNMQAGRTLQKDLRNKESYIVATEFLIGTDGRKMSKTWSNAIWLTDTPDDMYAKIMAINDDVIVQYFTLATNISIKNVERIEKALKDGENPMIIKKRLACQIITEVNGKNAADKAAEYFEKTVQKQELPSDIPIYQYNGQQTVSIIDLLVQTKLASSKSEARRLVEQGGVEVDDSQVTNPKSQIPIKDGLVIKIGKRRFLKLAIRN